MLGLTWMDPPSDLPRMTPPEANTEQTMNPSAQPPTVIQMSSVAHAAAPAAAPAPVQELAPVLVGHDSIAAPRPAHHHHVSGRLDAALTRAFDVAVSLILLTLLLPVVILTAIAIKLDSPGPVFYRARRVGHRGTELLMLKFRKMRADASGLSLTMDDDARFTRVGVLLAKFKIDEIPQLWNVLLGQMSLVGPRPESPEFVALHAEDYRSILSVRPGVTGLSQIAFAEESRILDDDNPLHHYVERLLPQKVGMDQMYARERTLGLNLRILFWTVAAVIMRRQVAVHRGCGTMNLRKR
jgi:lipopolysaccharide/colanic/teichoic acid biosynthesis glycosyltransferase